MSKWCGTCNRVPYDGCDDKCPIFGLHFEDLAKKHLTTISRIRSVLDNKSFLTEDIDGQKRLVVKVDDIENKYNV